MKNKGRGKALGVCLAFGVFVILLSFFVGAFAIGSPSAFNLKPGESLDASFSIMNRGESAEDIVVQVVVEEGGEYVSLVGDGRIEVSAGEAGPVGVRVSVPADARIGDVYSVTLLFAPLEGGVVGGGTVDLTFGYRRTLDINVVSEAGEIVEEPATTGGNTIWWVIGVIVLIIVIWLAMKGNGNGGAVKKGKKK